MEENLFNDNLIVAEVTILICCTLFLSFGFALIQYFSLGLIFVIASNNIKKPYIIFYWLLYAINRRNKIKEKNVKK
jgi:hypothetical protein